MRLSTSKQSGAEIAMGLCLAVPLLFFSAFVVVQVWQWHVTPWMGFAPPPYWTAFALLWLGGILSSSPADDAAFEQSSVPVWQWALGRCSGWGIMLLIGWLTT